MKAKKSNAEFKSDFKLVTGRFVFEIFAKKLKMADFVCGLEVFIESFGTSQSATLLRET